MDEREGAQLRKGKISTFRVGGRSVSKEINYGNLTRIRAKKKKRVLLENRTTSISKKITLKVQDTKGGGDQICAPSIPSLEEKPS